MSREPHPFKTEADLCAAFIAWAQPQGWTAYAETAGWDILLVHGDGTQIGVQAKLRLNLDVIGQAMEDQWSAWRETGPDFRAVLVPRDDGRGICQALGLEVFYYRGDRVPDPHYRHLFNQRLDARDTWGVWHYWNPKQRHDLPAYVPDVVAGASAPSQLTRWKIAALQIVATCELRGHITMADFKRYGIDPRRWKQADWMTPGDRAGEWKIVGPDAWIKQHPVVYPQVRAGVAKDLALELNRTGKAA